MSAWIDMIACHVCTLYFLWEFTVIHRFRIFSHISDFFLPSKGTVYHHPPIEISHRHWFIDTDYIKNALMTSSYVKKHHWRRDRLKISKSLSGVLIHLPLLSVHLRAPVNPQLLFSNSANGGEVRTARNCVGWSMFELSVVDWKSVV